jgi:PTS system beta-glucosides-specific IIC component
MLHLIEKEDNLYILLNLAYDAFFYYLPILVGFGAAKKLNIPAPMGALMGATMLAPNYVDMVANNQPFDFLGINIPLVSYSQTMIPVLLSVALLALLYHFFAKVSPELITTIVTPFLSILITVPITFIVLAPIGDTLGKSIAGALTAFGDATGFLGVGIVAALYNFLVMTGMHGPINMVFMTDFFEKGYMSGIASGGVVSIWACYGFKDKKEKSNALGYFISGFVGGITEPTLFGLCLKYRRCFIPLSIASFVGGAYMGLTGVVRYLVGGGSNFLMLVKFTGGTTANLVNAVIGCLMSMILAAVLTYIMGVTKEDKAEQNV